MPSVEHLTLDELRQQIFNCLYHGLAKEIAILREKLASEHVFAFVLYGSTYDEYFACAACSREFLTEPKEAYSRLGMDDEFHHVLTYAGEWGYIEGSSEEFDTLYSLTEALFDRIYEGETPTCVDENSFAPLFDECALAALQRLKGEGHFFGAPFEQDVQLGFHFSDSLNEQNIPISEQLNSAEWHRQVVSNHQESWPLTSASCSAGHEQKRHHRMRPVMASVFSVCSVRDQRARQSTSMFSSFSFQ